MKKIHKSDSWIIKAPGTEIYEIISDFENMPANFPGIAHSIKIIKKDGNELEIETMVKFLWQKIPISMKVTLIPGKGFIANSTNHTFKFTGHDEWLMENIEVGTWIGYSYTYDISKANFIVQIIFLPFFTWYRLWFCKYKVIDKIKQILKCD